MSVNMYVGNFISFRGQIKSTTGYIIYCTVSIVAYVLVDVYIIHSERCNNNFVLKKIFSLPFSFICNSGIFCICEKSRKVT